MTQQAGSTLQELRRSFVEDLNRSIVKAAADVCDDFPAENPEQVLAEGLRHLVRNLAQASLIMMEQDEDYPQITKVLSMQRNWGLPCPDTTYFQCLLDSRHSYTLTGNRGTAHLFEIETWAGNLGDAAKFRPHGSLDFQQRPLKGEPIVVKISVQKQDGLWIPIPEGQSTLLIRNYFYDWDNERPSMLTIERDGAIYPPPPLTLHKFKAMADRVLFFMNNSPANCRAAALQHLLSEPHKVRLTPVDFGFSAVCYSRGFYRCKPDEAVILEVKPPQVVFWHFALTNFQWEAFDYHHRQTSLNGFQAKLDDDGVFRAVISHQDPGVANWLDASGYELGLIAGRYYRPVERPEATLRTVKLAELDQHLPKSTACVDPTQRQTIIRNRKISTAARLCGD